MRAASGRIVMAYSAAPAAAAAVPALAGAYGEVIAVTLDTGQGRELESVRDRALAAGASRAHVLDARDEFARGYILPALRAGALYRDGSSAAPALERLLVAAKLLEIARIEQANLLAHGWPGAAGAAFERAVRTLDPTVQIVGRSWHSGNGAAPVRPLREPALEPAGVDISFSRGAPTALNGIEMGLADLVASLATIAAAHGFAPAGARDAAAHRTLQAGFAAMRSFRADPGVAQFAEVVSRQYWELIENGSWFSPLRAALDAFVSSANEPVSGLVRIRLFKGELETTAEELALRRLPLTLKASS